MAEKSNTLAERFGVNLEQTKAKYAYERDKRVRSDSDEQFIQVDNEGAYARYIVEDPWAPDITERDSLHDEVEVLIIGGGWVGLLTAARLLEAGIERVRIVEAGSDFGGTWYWNRYPGAQCDIESYVYLPLLEETGYVPKERFSYAPEIFEHAQRIGKHYGLYEKTVFQTWVNELRWDDEVSRWIVTTDRGDGMLAHHVVFATGSVSRPRLPGVPGIETYKGHSFHSSRWDYAYTGGNSNGDLHRLADKRVAVIGTGATGVQLIPHVAQSAKRLFVFQRTPSSVDERGNAPTDPDWANTLGPGWQRDRIRAFDAAITGRAILDPDGLGISEQFRALKVAQEVALSVDSSDVTPEQMAEIFQVAEHLCMNELRQRVTEHIVNPDVAEKLKPYYNYGCKRPTWNDDYLKTFNRPNVELVDVSDSKGIERITEKGVVANGIEYEVDCIIFASGFEITSDFRKRLGMNIYGERGESLVDHWNEGMRTMHALTASGFPNFFIVGGLFGFTLGSLNYTSTIEDQAQQVAFIISELAKRGAVAASPTREAEDEWITDQMGAAPPALGGASPNCTPGYYNQEGRQRDQRRDSRREGYGKGRDAYLGVLNDWRADGNLAGLKIQYPGDPGDPEETKQASIGTTSTANEPCG